MKFMQIKPQKARGRLDPAMWERLDWIAEEKYDGDRRIAQFCTDVVRFTGTRESVDGSGFVEKSDNVPHLSGVGFGGSRAAARIPLLTGTVLDGEIVAPYAAKLPGGKSKYVTAIMGSKPEEALRKQQASGWLEYVVFDCLWYKGQDVRSRPYHERRDFVSQAIKQWGNKYVSPAQQCVGPLKERYFNAIVADGGEGVVLKHTQHTYGDEKLWVKVKAETTADVVIVGFEPGKGKYDGLVGAIVFGQHKGKRLVRVGTCSGFDDGLRFALTERPQTYLGKVIEIKHNGREPTGAFRHPRFKRFRLDKSAKDCVLDMEER